MHRARLFLRAVSAAIVLMTMAAIYAPFIGVIVASIPNASGEAGAGSQKGAASTQKPKAGAGGSEITPAA